VFTTVHANNVFDVIGRFVNMGVDTYSFVSALNGILAQRLVRLTCTQCAKPYSPTAAELARSKITLPKHTRPAFTHGLGCAHCRGTGYKGRKAIAETLELTDALRDLLAERAPLTRIKAAAREVGFQSLREAAVAAAIAGNTTLEEINRVTPVA
jgi:general secretion pathway protein E